MKNYKGFIAFLALTIIILPGLTHADGTYYYGSQAVNEAAPVKTVGTVISSNTNVNTVGATTYTNNTSTGNSTLGDILGINIKSKAERDAEKAAQDAAAAKAADNARVARNADGSFAYGYTNGSGAQYTSGAKYVDARLANKSRYTASAGSTVNGGFLPTTFGGWFLAIILIGILVAITRALMDKMNPKPVHAHAHH